MMVSEVENNYYIEIFDAAVAHNFEIVFDNIFVVVVVAENFVLLFHKNDIVEIF